MVKAFPQPSTKYEETVCCAGVSVDTGELLRLYPIRFRRLPKEERFDRFDLVEMTITKASDPRPESYRVAEESIRVLDKGDKLSDESKVRLWTPFIAPSIKSLLAENEDTHRSLGIVRPDYGSVKFKIRPADSGEESDKHIADLVFRQQSLLEEPLKPLSRPKHSFSYKFSCAGFEHTLQIHDWEVQAASNNYERHYGSEEKALEMLTDQYQNRIPENNLHFIMGTMKAHPTTFILIGLLRSSLDPAELLKQGDLLKIE